MQSTITARAPIELLRKPTSLVAGVACAVFAVFTHPSGFDHGIYKLLEVSGFFLVFVGVMGRIWSLAHITGRKNRVLCRQGPYSLCRNPLYFSSFLGAAGVCLGAQSLPAAIVVVMLFLFYYHFVIRAEEQRLSDLFGEQFVAYCRRVPRFWPKRGALRSDYSITLDAQAFGRGLLEVSWFLVAVVAVESLETVKELPSFPNLELPW